MEEVILRSWRDAYPLLKKSIGLELDFANIKQNHMTSLGGSLELLEEIGSKESISIEGRLKSFQNESPEDIYTGTEYNTQEGKQDDAKFLEAAAS
jgi:hypothetical protein